jgi:rhodanese-related sulfurtransferase
MKAPLKITAIFLSLLAWGCIISCSGQKVEGLTRLDNKGFEKRMKKPGYVLLDVRTPEEYKNGFIAGAINIDVLEETTFLKNIETLDKNNHYLIYCRSGRRSVTAAKLMQERGFKNLYDLESGISRWNGAISKAEK